MDKNPGLRGDFWSILGPNLGPGRCQISTLEGEISSKMCNLSHISGNLGSERVLRHFRHNYTYRAIFRIFRYNLAVGGKFWSSRGFLEDPLDQPESGRDLGFWDVSWVDLGRHLRWPSDLDFRLSSQVQSKW
jgi:hypothetical protein